MKKILDQQNCYSEVHQLMQIFGKEEFIKLFEFNFLLKIKQLVDDINYNELFVNCKKFLHSIVLLKLPLTSSDVMKIGFKNAEIGEKLRLAKMLWIESNCLLDKESLIILLK
jgi:hypothetical protein